VSCNLRDSNRGVGVASDFCETESCGKSDDWCESVKLCATNDMY
jgi:hypothetical protein